MKVCTDACLFGAWTASFAGNISSALDIGTGTGLLSLMLAQQCPATIESIEIDHDAWLDASQNFSRSGWNGRLTAIHSSLQDYAPQHNYDLVISNPPFFDRDVRSADLQRNLALHGDQLSLSELFEYSAKVLNAGGRMALLVGSRREAELEKLCIDHGFYIIRKCSVRQTPAHPVFRLMYLLGRDGAPRVFPPEEIIIRTNGNTYSVEFRQLLQEYYLQV